MLIYECYVYSLYEETIDSFRFLLCARKVDDTFYISQFENFASFEGRVKRGYVATVKKRPDQRFSLLLKYCTHCNGVLGKKDCGNQRFENNEVLATISHVCILYL